MSTPHSADHRSCQTPAPREARQPDREAAPTLLWLLLLIAVASTLLICGYHHGHTTGREYRSPSPWSSR